MNNTKRKQIKAVLAVALLSWGQGRAAQNVIVTVRTAPLYNTAGELKNMAIVVNLRTPSGQPAADAISDWRIVGPWGVNGWQGPAPDGFIWASGPGQYLPGQYRLLGTVDGQPLNIKIEVPKVAPFVPAIEHSQFVEHEANSQNFYLNLKLPTVLQGKMITSYLYPRNEDNQQYYARQQAPNILFSHVDDADSTDWWYFSSIAWNVKNLYAPKGQEQTPLIGYLLSSRWFKPSQVPVRQWQNITLKASK